MAFLHDDVLDNGLQVLTDDADELHICSQEPVDYSGAITTYTLGLKAAPTVGAPADRSPDGRKATISAIADGSVSANGTATHWALVDTVNSRLLAAGPLAVQQVVSNGNSFTLTDMDIGIPDAADPA